MLTVEGFLTPDVCEKLQQLATASGNILVSRQQIYVMLASVGSGIRTRVQGRCTHCVANILCMSSFACVACEELDAAVEMDAHFSKAQ